MHVYFTVVKSMRPRHTYNTTIVTPITQRAPRPPAGSARRRTIGAPVRAGIDLDTCTWWKKFLEAWRVVAPSDKEVLGLR